MRTTAASLLILASLAASAHAQGQAIAVYGKTDAMG
jgi:hypothetical protein